LKSPLVSSIQMLPPDLHRNISHTPCCCKQGKCDAAATAPSQTATHLGWKSPKGTAALAIAPQVRKQG